MGGLLGLWGGMARNMALCAAAYRAILLCLGTTHRISSFPRCLRGTAEALKTSKRLAYLTIVNDAVGRRKERSTKDTAVLRRVWPIPRHGSPSRKSFSPGRALRRY